MHPRPGLDGVGGRLAPAASRHAPPGGALNARLDALEATPTSAAARWRHRSPRHESPLPAGSAWQTSQRRGSPPGAPPSAPRRTAQPAGARTRSEPLGASYGVPMATATTCPCGASTARRPTGAREVHPAGSIPALTGPAPGPESACEPPSGDGADRRVGAAAAGGAFSAVATVRRELAAGAGAGVITADGSAPASRTPAAVPSRPPGSDAPRLATRVQRPGRPSVPGARRVRRQVWPPGGPSRRPWRARRPCRWRRRWCASRWRRSPAGSPRVLATRCSPGPRPRRRRVRP